MTALETWARSLFKEHSEPADTVAADQSTGNVGGSAGRLHSLMHPSTESPASVPVDTHSSIGAPRGVEGEADSGSASPANSNFGTVPVIGWIE